MRTPFRWILLVSTALSLGPRGVGAQSGASTPPPLTFGVEIEVVNLSVSVTDAQNQYVTGLKESEFSVFEDGIRQKLTIFSHQDVPISLALMIDGSASMIYKLKEARAAASQFVKTLRPQDLAQVVEFNDRVRILEDFTGDHAKLLDAISRTDSSGPTALHNALYVTLKDLDRQGKRKAAGDTRRRAIVILSDGEDTASIVTDKQVIELAKKTEIAIYTILLRSRAYEADRPAFSQANYLLSTLAQESGGQAFMPNSLSELDVVYGRIAEELRTLYSVGYVSSNARRDGKWRRIVVRIAGHEDYGIRHKIGYYGQNR
jgi:Ca-activated chloride channel family protein